MSADQQRGEHWFAWHTSSSLGTAPTLVLVPVGAVEQHGTHLATGTDTWIATEVAVAVARQRRGVLVGEPLPYGCSAHHRAFPGTVSLRVSTFLELISDVAESLIGDGHIPVFINGHGGNRGPLQAAAQSLLERGHSMWALSYFDLIRDEALAEFEPTAMGHACALETSMMLYLQPETVADLNHVATGSSGGWPSVSLYVQAAADTVVHPLPFDQLDPHGVLGDPRKATPAAGRLLFDSAVARVGEAVDRIREHVCPESEG